MLFTFCVSRCLVRFVFVASVVQCAVLVPGSPASLCALLELLLRGVRVQVRSFAVCMAVALIPRPPRTSHACVNMHAVVYSRLYTLSGYRLLFY